ncbi:MAG: thiamine pyrophosphate-dependent enzyme [Myxococcota bacterium]
MSLAKHLQTLQALPAPTDPTTLPMTGLQAVVAGTVSALPDGAWWVPGLREHAGCVLLDVPEARRADPYTGAAPYRVAPVTPSPANRALHAVGLAHASGNPAIVHLGVGSVADGAFVEALNLAALLGAQATFIVAEIPLDAGAPVGPQSAAGTTALAEAHGIAVFSADGNNARSVQQAVQAAAASGAPAVVVATLATDQPLISGESS